jgi:hypothetical protein
MGRQLVKSCLPTPIVVWKSERVDHSWDLFFLGWWPLLFSLEWWVLSGMGCMVPQPFVTGGNRSYPKFWVVTGYPLYPGY